MKKGTKHFEIGVNKKKLYWDKTNILRHSGTLPFSISLKFGIYTFFVNKKIEVRQKLKIHFIAVQSPIFFLIPEVSIHVTF